MTRKEWWAWMASERAADAERAAAMKARTRYGVFIWDALNRYPASAALKVYKLQHAADRAAEKIEGAVVRTIRLDS